MARKIEKALYGPSMWEVIGGAVLGLFSGVLVACVYLVFKPVPTVRELPKEQPRGVVYYIPGNDSRAKGATWQNKQRLFIAGKTVQVVEDELNNWVVSLKSVASAAPATPAKSEGSPGVPSDRIFTPSKPNFRIANDRLQIGLTCTLNWYGLMSDVTFQSTGMFQKDGDHFVYTPDKVYLGSCPLHYIPGASSLLLSQIAAKDKVPDEFRDAWNKLNEVVVLGGVLKLVAAQ